MTLALTSTAFQESANIAGQYTGDGRNISPPLKWQNPPAGIVPERDTRDLRIRYSRFGSNLVATLIRAASTRSQCH